ncbi:MAG TPA: alpha/beta fold hydrolase [Gaiellaceae bacterium]|jgi:3-oxoadipate enol-lactonase|nr:alpha/beta fold hydrolase [Gaiellaceae bacterium]
MTLVLYGSLGSTAAMWEPQAPLGAALAVELPGHGAEPLHDEVSVESLAQRVLDRVEGRFSLVGLSLGGAVAMRVAATAPERVERLALACTSPDFGDPALWLERAATVRRDGLESIVDAVLGRWFTPSFPHVARYREMFVSIDREGYARCCEALAGWDGRDDLRRIEAPTLVLAGAGDPTSPPAHAGEIGTLVRDSRVAVIEGARHLANVERADEFNRLLKEHL